MEGHLPHIRGGTGSGTEMRELGPPTYSRRGGGGVALHLSEGDHAPIPPVATACRHSPTRSRTRRSPTAAADISAWAAFPDCTCPCRRHRRGPRPRRRVRLGKELAGVRHDRRGVSAADQRDLQRLRAGLHADAGAARRRPAGGPDDSDHRRPGAYGRQPPFHRRHRHGRQRDAAHSLQPAGQAEHRRIFRGCGFFDPDKPIRKYSKKELHDLLHKEPTTIKVEGINLTYAGLIPTIQKSYLSKDVEAMQPHIRAFVERAVTFTTCPDCGGTRLNEAARSSKIRGINIADVCAMQISDLVEWVRGLDEPSYAAAARRAGAHPRLLRGNRPRLPQPRPAGGQAVRRRGNSARR